MTQRTEAFGGMLTDFFVRERTLPSNDISEHSSVPFTRARVSLTTQVETPHSSSLMDTSTGALARRIAS